MRFPIRLGVIRGWKVVDRGRGTVSSFLASAPVTPTEPRQEVLDEVHRLFEAAYGITICPDCHQKVAVLIDGVCRDCGPEIA